MWEWLNCVQEGSGCNVKVWFPECPLFGDKNTLRKRFGAKDSVRCLEFRGGRFSEVANVLQVWDFQSVTRTLSALGSVSAQGGSTVYVTVYAKTNISANFFLVFAGFRKYIAGIDLSYKFGVDITLGG